MESAGNAPNMADLFSKEKMKVHRGSQKDLDKVLSRELWVWKHWGAVSAWEGKKVPVCLLWDVCAKELHLTLSV